MRMIWKMLAAIVLTALGTGAVQATPSAWEQARQLGHGVNVIGYDPLWRDPAQARFKAYHFTKIKQAGFSTVRVVLQAFDHMDADNRLDPKWLATLDWVVREASGAGLNILIDEHDFDKCSEDLARCTPRLKAFWSQIAPRYAQAGDNVFFELLNEPHGQLDADHWNALLAELIPLVRRSNPTRTLIIGPTQWNSRTQLDTLRLPEQDRHIIVTFHYYDPMHFTHQGASWVPGMKDVHGVTCCTAEEKAKVDSDFAAVAAWSKTHDRPILLGEFGAREGGDMASRADWTSTVARTAEKYGFAWAYWQFDGDFVVWDMKANDWVHPILDALNPGAR
jgi:endoglucanase